MTSTQLKNASNGRESGRIPMLDVLRGIAVLSVVFEHNGYHGIGRGGAFFDEFVWPVVRHGYLGVQLFFVISGYCIMGAVESAETSTTPLLTFVRRRARRIYPTYWLSLILLIVLGLATIGIAGKTWWSIFPLNATDWMLNLVLLQKIFGAPNLLLPYWSLSIEVQFYFVMAACLLIPNYRSFWLTGLLALHIAAATQPSVSISGTALAHFPEFACGIAAYAFRHPHHFRRGTHWYLWGLTIVAIIVNASTTRDIFNVYGEFSLCIKQLFCLAFAITLLFLLSHSSNFSCRSVILNGLSWLGMISYSVYLTHVPVGSRIFNFVDRFVSLTGINFWAITFIATLSQILFGWMFFAYCERKWLNSALTRTAYRTAGLEPESRPLRQQLVVAD